MLQFSANAQSSPLSERKQSKDNVFTAAEENHFEFIDENPQSEKPGLFSIIKEMFSKKQHSDDARFTDVHQAVELCAQEVQTLSAEITALKNADQSEAVKAITQQLTELKTQFENTDASFSHRPPGIGPKSATELLQLYPNLESLYQHIDEVPKKWQTKLSDNKEVAFISRQITTLRTDIQLNGNLQQLRLK